MPGNTLTNSNNKMDSFFKAVPLLFMIGSFIAGMGIAQYQIWQNSNAIKETRSTANQVIRMEERQLYMQRDIKEIKQILQRR